MRLAAPALDPRRPAFAVQHGGDLYAGAVTQQTRDTPDRVLASLGYEHRHSNRGGRAGLAAGTWAAAPARRPPRPRRPMPGADPTPAHRQPRAACTWCGHPDHPGTCPVWVDAGPCPCARSLPAPSWWPAGLSRCRRGAMST